MTAAAKKATAKWNKYNMITVGCTIRRNKAEEFKAICAEKNLAANHVLKQLIDEYIENNRGGEAI